MVQPPPPSGTARVLMPDTSGRSRARSSRRRRAPHPSPSAGDTAASAPRCRAGAASRSTMKCVLTMPLTLIHPRAICSTTGHRSAATRPSPPYSSGIIRPKIPMSRMPATISVGYSSACSSAVATGQDLLVDKLPHQREQLDLDVAQPVRVLQPPHRPCLHAVVLRLPASMSTRTRFDTRTPCEPQPRWSATGCPYGWAAIVLARKSWIIGAQLAHVVARRGPTEAGPTARRTAASGCAPAVRCRR